MKFKAVSFTTLLIIFCISFSKAQEVLTLEEAIKIALENNYDIKLYKNNLQINKNDATLANAGVFPYVTGTFGDNATVTNTKQTQSTGQVVDRNGAKNTNLNYGANLNWTVFDGFGMFATYNRLKELRNLGEANLKSTVLATLTNVINSYYALAGLQQTLKSVQSALELSQLRYNIALNRYKIGRAAKLEVLNASVDLNTDTTNLLRQVEQIKNIKVQLNQIIARNAVTDFKVIDTIMVNTGLSYEPLQEQAEKLNPDLQAALVNQRIAEYSLKEVKADRYPVIGLNTGYNYQKNTSELGFARSSQGQGFTYGVTASINIFNGFLQHKNERNAAILIDNAKLEYNKLNESIKAQLTTAYQTYLTNIELVKLEEHNQQIAQQNLDITVTKFRLGSITPLEFREAQRNYVDARVRFTNAQYQAKLAEVSLKQISGTLELD
ncbi:TolC family protein [Pedobacter sp. HMF7647]|uniref:TolC family protein n=1 Tax=Hufsiella arboris TaxID=2695275 RepID=A0A7K1YA14_9SPHI|nr:TolC family protein [Hufsiella arboris]MXV50959.1 TolC family protein [Hufsiella arboris]